MEQQRYRYPGTRPFTEQEREMFFGRDRDIAGLFQMIRLEQLVVLFGKSGLGKTSLLSAGVLPLLRETGKYMPVEVRFGYAGDLGADEIFWRKLSAGCDLQTGLWQKITVLSAGFNHHTAEGFWLLAKCLAAANNEKTLVLVFDQFEELFNFGDDDVNRFAEILDTLLFGEIPQKVQDAVYAQLENNVDYFTHDELELLFEPVRVKTVLSVRSDKMSLLSRLKHKIPHILQKTYELKPLNLDDARDALIKPAHYQGGFVSPQFDYTAGAENKILDYLSDQGTKQIEAFQLQLVCQYCENIILKKAAAKAPLHIEPTDLGDLSTIFTRHYDNIINQITGAQQQLAVRRLIEENMIIDGNRVPLPDKVIQSKHNISPALLKQLVDSRLLRREPNTVGGFSYEISHDTLVEPILKSYEVRRVREEDEERERQRQEELRKLREQRRRQRTIITIVSVAAVISLAFAVFGLWQMKVAQNRLKQAISYQAAGKEKDAIQLKENEKYDEAVKKYNELLRIYRQYPQFGFDTNAVYNSIAECRKLDSISQPFYKYMNKASALIESRDFDSVKAAYYLYQKAKDLDYRFAKRTFDKFTPKLQIAMDRLIRQAENNFRAGGFGKEIAKRNLDLLLQVEPDNPKVIELKKQLNL